MSLSPSEESPGGLEAYETGWVALHLMLREGRSLSGRERHCVYVNEGGGRFADVSSLTSLDLPDDGRAAARVDWDLDGRGDLVLTSRSGPRVRILRNAIESENDWLQVGLVGRGRNRDAIGARVELRLADGSLSVESLRAGEGFLAQSSKWLHFGLGPAAEVVSAVVRWPDGEREEFGALAVGGRHVLERGSGTPSSVVTASVRLKPSVPTEVPGTERARIPLATPLPLPGLDFELVDGSPAGIDLPAITKAEGPVLLLVWASWCAPCLGELAEWAARTEVLRAAGVTVLAVSADEAPQRAAAERILDELDWPHGRTFASARDLEVLDTLQEAALDRRRRLPLPAAFLVDRQARVSVIYKGPLSPATVAADARTLDGAALELRERAVPFPGRWHGPPPELDLALLETRLASRGLERAARDIGLRRIVTRETSRAEVLDDFGLVHARQGDLQRAAENFMEATALDPERFDSWLHLATALHQLGRLEEAIAAYERALWLDARSTDARFNLSLALLVSGDVEGAWQQHALLSSIDPATGDELGVQLRGLQER